MTILKTQLRNFAVIFTIFCNFGVGQMALAETTDNQASAQNSYQQGIKSYQQEDFKGATQSFLDAIQKSPDNKYALYNWGLGNLQLGDMSKATAAWRKALAIDPDFTSARLGLDYLSEKFAGATQQSADSNWEAFRSLVLTHFAGTHLMVLLLLLMTSAGLILLRYWGQRNSALTDETPLPPVPWLGIVLGSLFVVSLGLSLSKGFDFYVPRATIIVETVDLRSGPSEQDSSLLEVMGGAEVIIKHVAKDWVQVSYPGGLTGWIPKNTLLHSSGRAPW